MSDGSSSVVRTELNRPARSIETGGLEATGFVANPRALFGLLWAAAALLVLVTLIRCVRVIPNHGQLNHVSGTWMGMALDFAEGVFYRPLFSEDGYGGTRFFPLHFLLQGGLIRLGLGVVPAGHLTGLVSALALISGLYVFLRQLGIRAALAAPLAAMVLASASMQLAVTTIRGDLLPAALNVWGLIFCAATLRQASRRTLLAAALFFVLAFSAKVTTVFGFGAGFAALLLNGRRKAAWALCVYTASGMALVLVAMCVASDGRILDIMLTCASGGAGVRNFIGGPACFLANYLKHDSSGLVFILLGGAALLSSPVRFWRTLPALMLVTTGIVTLLIFMTPGTSYNHLLDMHTAALVVLAFCIVMEARVAKLLATGVALTGIVAAFHSAFLFNDVLELGNVHSQVLTELSTVRGPILSQDPLLPAVAGQRPYMLDEFMLRLMNRRNPTVAEGLLTKVERRYFAALILRPEPGTNAGREYLEDRLYTEGFREAVMRNYEPRAWIGPYILLRPRRATHSQEGTSSRIVAPAK